MAAPPKKGSKTKKTEKSNVKRSVKSEKKESSALELKDVKDAYEAIGIIESSILLDCFEKIAPSHISRLEELNQRMIKDIQELEAGQEDRIEFE